MAIITEIRRSFWARHRLGILVLALLLFLPPLAALPQLSGDTGFCGTWCPRMFWAWRKSETLREFLGGIFRAWLGVVLVGGILVVTVAVGRQWCSHVCPIGGAMELGSRLVPRWLKLDFRRVPAAPVRYGYLAVYLLAPILGIGSLCCSYCNFASVPRLLGAPFSRADMAFFLRTAGLIDLGLVVLLGFFAKGGRAYCNLLCPIGALDALASRFGARLGRRVRIDATKCTDCGKCATVCPTWAIAPSAVGSAVPHTIDQLSCMPCRECEKICAAGAIHFGRP
jgi:ferredoxin-type protein NapH